MRILVTGGAGFVGSHACESLVRRGDRVVAFDDLSTGRLENVEALRRERGFELVVGSVTDRARVAELVRSADLVLHLAAAVGVRLVVEEPLRTLETNVLGTEAVVRACSDRGVPLVLASSSEVYGKGTALPFREDGDLVLGPTSCARWAYACSKAQGEWLALAHHRDAGLPVVVTRFFNTVGPRQSGRYGMVLPTFASQALAGEPLTVHGDGAQTRCFCHVEDTVSALLLLADRVRAPHVNGRVFNVGSDHEVTIARLAALVRDAAGSRSPIVHVPYERAFGPGFEDLARRVPDLSRLERATGFRPSTPLETIVADVVAEQRRRRAG